MTVAEFDTAHPEGKVLAPAQSSAASAGEAAKEKVDQATGDPKGPLPEFKVVQRVGSIPVVADGIQTFENVVKSNHLTASIYSTVGGIAAKSYDIASPILATAKPLVDRADAIANSGLDFVESKYPYPFKASSGEIIENVKQSPTVAKAQGVYDARISPVVHTEIVQRAVEQLTHINHALANGVVAVKDRLFSTTHVATEQVQNLAAALIDQLYKLQNQGKDVPPKLKESAGQAYNDVRGIVGKEDKTTQEKMMEIGQYVQSIIQPELEKAQSWIFQKKEAAEQQAGETASDVETKTGEAAETAQQAVEEGKKQADETTEAAKKKTGEAAGSAEKTAHKKSKEATDTVKQHTP